MTHTLFFYGTLMHPSVLTRVLGCSPTHVRARDALLADHARLHVKSADYPAVVRAADAAKVLKRELDEEQEAKTRGTVVEGLTDADLDFLDTFEGDEYSRERVTVEVLGESSPTSLEAEVYLWIAPLSRLEARLWSYTEFLEQKSHRWTGGTGDRTTDAGPEGEFDELERRRRMNGKIVPPDGEEAFALEVPPDEHYVDFGKQMRARYFDFDEDYVPLNHGSYGVAPRPVVDRVQELQRRSNAAPDLFIKKDVTELMASARSRIATYVKCDFDDIVVLPNATTGVNAVLRSIASTLEQGDKLMYFSTTVYPACASSLQQIIDMNAHLDVSLVDVPLRYPMSHDDVVATVRSTLEREQARSKEAGNGRVRLALFDAISSMPGVVVPWERLVTLCREFEVLSLVDAAHMVGQLPVDLRQARPDFWVSNVHKWLYVHRGAAILYVAKRHQHLMHSIPIGQYYDNARKASRDGCPAWTDEFAWNGTLDFSPVLSIESALEFRDKVCGGDERIQAYCHKLAKEGGELVARELGTSVMQTADPASDGELIANMVNVELPMSFPLKPNAQSDLTMAQRISKTVSVLSGELLSRHSTFALCYAHNDRWWARLSAQIYLDLDDFAYGAKALKDVCSRLESGELAV